LHVQRSGDMGSPRVPNRPASRAIQQAVVARTRDVYDRHPNAVSARSWRVGIIKLLDPITNGRSTSRGSYHSLMPPQPSTSPQQRPTVYDPAHQGRKEPPCTSHESIRYCASGIVESIAAMQCINTNIGIYSERALSPLWEGEKENREGMRNRWRWPRLPVVLPPTPCQGGGIRGVSLCMTFGTRNTTCRLVLEWWAAGR